MLLCTQRGLEGTGWDETRETGHGAGPERQVPEGGEGVLGSVRGDTVLITGREHGWAVT